MSQNYCTHALANTLMQGYGIASGKGGWDAVNPTQIAMLSYYDDSVSDLELFTDGDMTCKAAFTHTEINDFLAEAGFTIELEPFKDEDSFGVATILKVSVDWVAEGRSNTLVVWDGDNATQYPGVSFEADNDTTKFYTAANGDTVAALKCKNGDTVYIALADEELCGPLLLSKCLNYMGSLQPAPAHEMIMPMIDMDMEDDISWIMQLGFSGQSPTTGRSGRYFVAQAKSQTKLQLDHLGAVVENAVAVEFGLESCFTPTVPIMKVDKPFFIWFTRDGANLPYYCGYITEECWKRPKRG